MAVTKIRKMSSWTLLIVSIISLVVLGMFYAGGVVDPSVEMKEPIYTGLLINWTSVLFFVTIISNLTPDECKISYNFFDRYCCFRCDFIHHLFYGWCNSAGRNECWFSEIQHSFVVESNRHVDYVHCCSDGFDRCSSSLGFCKKNA